MLLRVFDKFDEIIWVFLNKPLFYCTYWLGDHPQPDSVQAVDGMRHVGFGVHPVLYHCLCNKNDVILYDQSNS